MRAAVLAGGNASRFAGQPKGLARIGGVRILDRVVETLKEALGVQPALFAGDPAAAGWRSDLNVEPDRLAGRGSLVGIHAAVAAGREPVLVVAWDMPFLPAALLRTLAERSSGFDVFLPESGGPRGVEPLCAVYGPGCEPAIREQLSRGDWRATGFHGAVRAGTLPRAQVAAFGDPSVLFFNVNTAADLQQAEEMWSRRG